MDRLIIERLVKLIGDRFARRKTTEVVEVHGKHNFDSYARVLEIVNMPTSIVADQDYVLNIGSDELKNLFSADCDGIDRKVLLDKKSRDADSLIEAIEQAAETKDFSKVSDIIEYVKQRVTKLKDDLSAAESESLGKFITSKAAESTYILALGEIEDYLPAGVNSPGSLIAFLEDPKWMQKIEKEPARELLGIVSSILQISVADESAIQADFAA